ncbi:RNA-binding protein, partial [Bacillus spizizenii]|nr:RNA-binding protein [Bacillus spizizenii]
MTDQPLEDLIVRIVTPLVDHPDDLRVIRDETDQKFAVRLSVHKSDTGK